MTGLLVRHARREDLPRIVAMAQECETAAQWTFEKYAKFITTEITEPKLFLVLETNDRVNGFAVGQAAAGEWEIENIVIDPRVQCSGLGSHLLREFLSIARQSGRAVFLEVRESNHSARKLYQKLDFREIGRRKSYYQRPQEDAILLKLSF
jgi:[ribosomal protein S18]-alanine N-acetyltransferase